MNKHSVWAARLAAAKRSAVLAGLAMLAWQAGVQAATFSSTNLTAFPPNLKVGLGGPMIMLVASKDHTLFAPIYTDFEDVDGDGVLDFTFKPTFRYYGYFDSQKCYGYVQGRGAGKPDRFEPKESVQAGTYKCTSSAKYWSGNFLNWATMTRLDVVRKLLYGGYRVEDTPTDTTLEMAQMSWDAHSFVKYYAGGDDAQYFVPYTNDDINTEGLTICSRGSNRDETTQTDGSSPLMRVARGNYSLWATIGDKVCRWNDNGEAGPNHFGEKARAFSQRYGTEDSGAPLTVGHALKTVLPNKSDAYSTELAIRVQACPQNGGTVGRGGERCTPYVSDNGDVVYKPTGLLQKFGSSASNDVAARAEFGLLTGSFEHPMNGGALRKNIGTINDEINLQTGQFCYDRSNLDPSAKCAGIVSSFDRIKLVDAGNYEANHHGDTPHGEDFVLPEFLQENYYPSWGNPVSEMLVQALSYLGGYETVATRGATDDSLGMPAPAPVDPLMDTDSATSTTKSKRYALYGHGICRAQSVLMISSGSATFDSMDSYGSTYGKFNNFRTENALTCTGDACNITGNSIELWTDKVGGIEGINGSLRSVGAVDGGYGHDCSAKSVGAGGKDASGTYARGLSGVAGLCPDVPSIKGSYLGAGAAFFANTTAIRKPESLTPATGSTVRKDQLPSDALRVKTYAASLAGGVARVEVPIPVSVFGQVAKRKIVITPESLWTHGKTYDDGSPKINVGAMLTFRAIGREQPFVDLKNQKADLNFGGSGTYVVTWNDTQFGGDYDMDIVGFLRWELTRKSPQSKVWQLDVYTDILNVDAGDPGSHGFSIIGTLDPKTVPAAAGYNGDGRYLTHGANGISISQVMCANYSDLDQALKCGFEDTRANTSDGGGEMPWPASSPNGKNDVTFYGATSTQQPYTSTVKTSFLVEAQDTDIQASLHEPLWYMAKYGSFDTGSAGQANWAVNAQPGASNKFVNTNWDKEQNDPSRPCLASGQCADGEPDGYFLARRPDLLESRLENLLERVANVSNSAVATSSTQLIEGSLKYVAGFVQSERDWSGELQAFPLLSSGYFSTSSLWQASVTLAAQSARSFSAVMNGTSVNGSGTDRRQIITNDINDQGQPVGRAFRVDTDGTSASTALSSTYLSNLTGLAADTVTAADALDLVQYVRGSDAQEGRLFRLRPPTGVLGPVVSASPWVQNPATSAKFVATDFPGSTPSYLDFVLNRAQQNKVVWVGSHDGMVHGFAADTGEALFSYVPGPVVSRLKTQADVSGKSALPLVDGAPFTADVLPGDWATSTWRTYLFGSLGRGGKAVFALDVTDTGKSGGTSATKGDLDESKAADVFKWVFTDSDDADLGYNVTSVGVHAASGQASTVVRLNNGKFAVMVPNGYQPSTGRAALFFLYVEGPDAGAWSSTGGAHYRKLVPLETDAGNGMMGATWMDLDGNGTADVVYATDLHGNVWKFDIRSSDPADWGSAFVRDGAAVPFFTALACSSTALPDPAAAPGTATNACSMSAPITTNPVLIHPPYGGTLVGFGTGQAIETGDFPNDARRDRFITVWDRGRYAEDQIFPPPASTSSTTFVSPTLPSMAGTALSRFTRIELRLDAAGANAYRVRYDSALKLWVPVPVGASPDPFVGDDAHDGWYLDFPSGSEQLISSPVVRRTFVSFTSVRPLATSDQESTCSTTPRGRVWAFDLATGLTPKGLLGVVNLEGGVQADIVGLDSDDQQVTVQQSRQSAPAVEGQQNSPQCGPGKVKAKFLGYKVDKDGCVNAGGTRLQWRELPGLRTLQ